MAQTIELVRVKTTLGDRVYPLDTRVYSNVGGKDLFFREAVGDLSGSEMILWHNEGIDKTLEEIEPYLQKSPRYAQAEQAVYATNRNGQKIPRFRIQLIRALTAKGVVATESDENLEQKIMQEQGKDFTPKEYAAMKQFLYSELQRISKEDGAPKRKEDAIEDWLKGETVAPLDSNIFYSLALATGSPVFEEWFTGAKETATSSTGFWGAYKFYTILRQTIMRYLARSKGELKQKSEGSQSSQKSNGATAESLDMTPEIQIVLHQFMEEINKEFSLARVVGLEKIAAVPEKHTSHAAAEKQEYMLAKGAFTGEALPGTEQLSLKQIIDGFNFFGHLSTYIFEEYFNGVLSRKYSAPEKLRQGLQESRLSMTELENYIVRRTFAEAVIMAVAQNLGLKRKAEFDYLNVEGILLRFKDKKTGEDILVKHRDAIAELMAEQIITGRIDTALGAAQLSTYKAMERWARLFDAVPQVYWEFATADHAIHMPMKDRQTTRDAQLYRRKTEKKSAQPVWL